MQQVLVPGRGRPYLDGDSLDHSAPLVWTIPDVMSTDECAATIARIEELGPAAAPVSTSRGMVMMPEVRNNERVMFDDVDLAARLFARIRDALPPALCGMQAVGANERFRCYRYSPGQQFAAHYDGAHIRSAQERSLLTLIVYLNEDFVGGRTAFLDFGLEAIPRTGTALVFQHLLLHEGCKVHSGIKYAMRSDVMYRL
ncbi:MAG: 2OG-Fe(II) oxygenase [Deltaproteobacteria bacterium]|nr:2OG-Fe(II) oxygenase [Deltaproteobacteria bacterium]